MSAPQGELLVGTRPSGYGVRSKTGGPIYTTKDGGFKTPDEAKEAGTELAAMVGDDPEIVPMVAAVRQNRRGRAPGTKNAPKGNGQASTPSTAPSAPSSAPKAPVGAKS